MSQYKYEQIRNPEHTAKANTNRQISRYRQPSTIRSRLSLTFKSSLGISGMSAHLSDGLGPMSPM